MKVGSRRWGEIGSYEGEPIKVGDLIKIRYVFESCHLNNRIAVWLGESFIHREDGTVIRNYKIHLLGQSRFSIIDKSLLSYIEPVNHGDGT